MGTAETALQKAPVIDWLFIDQALRLTFPERYTHHPLLYTTTIYRAEEMYQPREADQYGDSYGSGFGDPYIDDMGQMVYPEDHPNSQVIAAQISRFLQADVRYRNFAVGGSTIQHTIDQMRRHFDSHEFDTEIDHDVFISAGGIDLLTRTISNQKVLTALQEFFLHPLSAMGPVPSMVIEEIEALGRDYRQMLEFIVASPHSDKINRLSLSLLPNAAQIDMGKAEMLAVPEYQRGIAKTHMRNRQLEGIINFYRRTGAQLTNSVLLRTIEEFMIDHADDVPFEILVTDPFNILNKDDYRGEHPKAEAHDRWAMHYLHRVYVEDEEDGDELSESIGERIEKAA